MRSIIGMVVVVGAVGAGCGGGSGAAVTDSGGVDSGVTDSGVVDASAAGPSTCLEAKAALGVTADGPQTLYVQGDKAKPYSVYCAGMSSAEPREYLTLTAVTSTGSTANFSRFMEAGNQVTTSYDRVRLDPATLQIDLTDAAFARSTAQVHSNALGLEVTSVPFGVAMQCGAPIDGVTAAGNVDLTGNPFVLATASACADPGSNAAIPDAAHPATTVSFVGVGWGNGTAGSPLLCGRATITCLPYPTVNGQIQGLKLSLAYTP